MLRIRTGARDGLRWGAFGIVAAVFFALSGHSVQAAPYADIVVDANSGKVLHATNPDALRHPASLTKIMTLYLLFEQLEAGKLNLDSPLKVSEFAAGQSPTKLGLKAGSTIQVEDAIKGIITRSANDASVVVAEALAGSEPAFAKLMTRKAQALGMSRTVYKNASGLPDDDQVTTARDQSTLGRAVQERFPRYYTYFSTRSFTFRGQSIGNHNHLLGRVEGVDGIKTGYIRASGFNLVTSVHRGNRYLVAVVMGGSSAGSRDARMRELISEKIALASTKRSAPMIAEAMPSETKTAAKNPVRAKSEPKSDASRSDPAAEAKAEPGFALASAHEVPVRFTPTNEPAARVATAQTPRVVAGSTEPIRPVLVRTLTVRAGTQTASLTPTLVPAAAASADTKPAPVAVPAPQPRTAAPAAKIEVAAPAATPQSAAAPVRTAAAEPPPAISALPSAPAVAAAAPTVAPAAPVVGTPAPVAKPQPRSGWMIQVGAYPAEQEAKQRLSVVQSKASKMLTRADPFTETVDKGGTTLYRARFAGLDKDSAEAACKYLKRNDVDCVTIKN